MPIIKFLGFGERKIGLPNVSSCKLEPLEKVFRIGGVILFGLGGPSNLNIFLSHNSLNVCPTFNVFVSTVNIMPKRPTQIKGRFFPESMMHFSHCPKNEPKTIL